jgi:plasmid stability protein
MKTTLDLPDDLMRAVKIRAVEENRKLKDAIADLLRRGLSQKTGESPTVRDRVKLPLVRCAHEARPDEEMTPERVARVLLDEESSARARGEAHESRPNESRSKSRGGGAPRQ